MTTVLRTDAHSGPIPRHSAPARGFWKIPAAAAGITLLMTMSLIGLAEVRHVDVSSLLRDPAVEFDVPVLAGSLSSLGIMLLLLGAGATGLAAWIGRTGKRTLAGASALSTLMAVDDRMMLHERIFEKWYGVPEEITLAAYAVAGLAQFAAVWLGPLRRYRLALLVPGVLLAVSLATDTLGASYVVEDVIKIASFAAWSAFWFAVSASVCGAARMAAAENGPEPDQP